MQRQEQDRKLAEGFRGGSRIDGRGVLRRGIFCATPTDDVIFAQRHFRTHATVISYTKS